MEACELGGVGLGGGVLKAGDGAVAEEEAEHAAETVKAGMVGMRCAQVSAIGFRAVMGDQQKGEGVPVLRRPFSETLASKQTGGGATSMQPRVLYRT